MAPPSINQYNIGTNGYVWMNGKLLSNLKEVEIKVTGNFSEIRTCGSYATQNVYTGYSGEGSLKLNKIDSTILTLMNNAYETGDLPDIKIITKLENKTSKKAERIAITEVVFTEYSPAKFSSSDVIEEEVPFKFSTIEVLETIE